MFTYYENYYRYRDERLDNIELHVFEDGSIKGQTKEYFIGNKKIILNAYKVNTPEQFKMAVKAPTQGISGEHWALDAFRKLHNEREDFGQTVNKLKNRTAALTDFKEKLDSKKVNASEYNTSTEEWLLATALSNKALDNGDLRQQLDIQAMQSLAKDFEFSKDKATAFSQAASTIKDIESIAKDLQKAERQELINFYIESLPQQFLITERQKLKQFGTETSRKQAENILKTSSENLTNIFTSLKDGTHPALREGNIRPDGKSQMRPPSVYINLPSGKSETPRGSTLLMLRQEAESKGLFNGNNKVCFVEASQYAQKLSNDSQRFTITRVTRDSSGANTLSGCQMVSVDKIEDKELRDKIEASTDKPKFEKLVFDGSTAKNAAEFIAMYEAAAQWGGTFLSDKKSRQMVQAEAAKYLPFAQRRQKEVYDFCSLVSTLSSKAVANQVQKQKAMIQRANTVSRNTAAVSY